MSEQFSTRAVSRKTGAALMALLAALFLLINKASYHGYFQHDDFAHLSWCTKGAWTSFVAGALSPEFYPHLFRPLGHLHYHLMEKAVGLTYWPFLAAVQVYHLAAAWVLWMVLRRLRFGVAAAAAVVVFFTLNMAVFRIFWNPAFVFDLGCGLFCLISFLLWMDRRWMASFVFFFLAYRWKETAIMLPAVLGLYEILLAERKEWRRLLPFLAVSAWFGVQGLLSFRGGSQTEYQFAATGGALWQTVRYYASRVFLIPWAGLVLLVAPWFGKDRRLQFGCAAFWVLLCPMLLLPGHLNDTYLYVPMLGAAVAVAALFERWGRLAILGFFLIWLPADYLALRTRRSDNLHEADENRPYLTALAEIVKAHPNTREFVFEASPAGLPDWGIESALRYFYPPKNVTLQQIRTDQDRAGVPAAPAVLLGWDPLGRQLRAMERRPDAAYPAYFRMNGLDPVWALTEGWHGADKGYRWSTPRATAVLQQPAGATEFQLQVLMPPEQQETAVVVALDGVALGEMRFRGKGSQSGVLAVPAGLERQVRVELTVPEGFRPRTADPRGLGVAVEEFGFSTRQPPSKP
ncbi:MAG: hypothetical protein IPP47_11300 [Bryobacterales bacterium]|nr:hypothetical protein [Bryobacterales bacterium]